MAVPLSAALLDGSHPVQLVATCCSEGTNSTNDAVLQSLHQAGAQRGTLQTRDGMNLAL
jgi:hypothetical protein